MQVEWLDKGPQAAKPQVEWLDQGQELEATPEGMIGKGRIPKPATLSERFSWLSHPAEADVQERTGLQKPIGEIAQSALGLDEPLDPTTTQTDPLAIPRRGVERFLTKNLVQFGTDPKAAILASLRFNPASSSQQLIKMFGGLGFGTMAAISAAQEARKAYSELQGKGLTPEAVESGLDATLSTIFAAAGLSMAGKGAGQAAKLTNQRRAAEVSRAQAAQTLPASPPPPANPPQLQEPYIDVESKVLPPDAPARPLSPTITPPPQVAPRTTGGRLRSPREEGTAAELAAAIGRGATPEELSAITAGAGFKPKGKRLNRVVEAGGTIGPPPNTGKTVVLTVDGRERVVKLSPEEAAKWDEVHKKFRQASMNTIGLNEQEASAKRKAMGMELAAEKRRISGVLTAKEAAKAGARKLSINPGDTVEVEGVGSGKVTALPFGKITVQQSDGNKVTVSRERVTKVAPKMGLNEFDPSKLPDESEKGLVARELLDYYIQRANTAPGAGSASLATPRGELLPSLPLVTPDGSQVITNAQEFKDWASGKSIQELYEMKELIDQGATTRPERKFALPEHRFMERSLSPSVSRDPKTGEETTTFPRSPWVVRYRSGVGSGPSSTQELVVESRMPGVPDKLIQKFGNTEASQRFLTHIDNILGSIQEVAGQVVGSNLEAATARPTSLVYATNWGQPKGKQGGGFQMANAGGEWVGTNQGIELNTWTLMDGFIVYHKKLHNGEVSPSSLIADFEKYVLDTLTHEGAHSMSGLQHERGMAEQFHRQASKNLAEAADKNRKGSPGQTGVLKARERQFIKDMLTILEQSRVLKTKTKGPLQQPKGKPDARMADPEEAINPPTTGWGPETGAVQLPSYNQLAKLVKKGLGFTRAEGQQKGIDTLKSLLSSSGPIASILRTGMASGLPTAVSNTLNLGLGFGVLGTLGDMMGWAVSSKVPSQPLSLGNWSAKEMPAGELAEHFKSRLKERVRGTVELNSLIMDSMWSVANKKRGSATQLESAELEKALSELNPELAARRFHLFSDEVPTVGGGKRPLNALEKVQRFQMMLSLMIEGTGRNVVDRVALRPFLDKHGLKNGLELNQRLAAEGEGSPFWEEAANAGTSALAESLKWTAAEGGTVHDAKQPRSTNFDTSTIIKLLNKTPLPVLLAGTDTPFINFSVANLIQMGWESNPLSWLFDTKRVRNSIMFGPKFRTWQAEVVSTNKLKDILDRAVQARDAAIAGVPVRNRPAIHRMHQPGINQARDDWRKQNQISKEKGLEIKHLREEGIRNPAQILSNRYGAMMLVAGGALYALTRKDEKDVKPFELDLGTEAGRKHVKNVSSPFGPLGVPFAMGYIGMKQRQGMLPPTKDLEIQLGTLLEEMANVRFNGRSFSDTLTPWQEDTPYGKSKAVASRVWYDLGKGLLRVGGPMPLFDALYSMTKGGESLVERGGELPMPGDTFRPAPGPFRPPIANMDAFLRGGKSNFPFFKEGLPPKYNPATGETKINEFPLRSLFGGKESWQGPVEQFMKKHPFELSPRDVFIRASGDPEWDKELMSHVREYIKEDVLPIIEEDMDEDVKVMAFKRAMQHARDWAHDASKKEYLENEKELPDSVVEQLMKGSKERQLRLENRELRKKVVRPPEARIQKREQKELEEKAQIQWLDR